MTDTLVYHAFDGGWQRRGVAQPPWVPPTPRPDGISRPWGVELPVPGVNCGLIDESLIVTDGNDPATTGTYVIPDGTDMSNKHWWGDLRLPSVMSLGISGANFLCHGGTFTPTQDTAVMGFTQVRSGANPIPILSDFEIRPQSPHAYRQGIRGHRVTAIRPYIHHCVDAIGTIAPTSGSSAGRADVTVQGGKITDFYYTRPDPQHGANGSHCDGWQHHSGTDFLIEGNFFEGKLAHAPGTTRHDGKPNGSWGGNVVVWQKASSGTASNTTGIFRKNWLRGGSAQMYLHAGITGTIEDNRFAPETNTNYWIRKLPGAATFDGLDGVDGNRGNVWWGNPALSLLNDGDELTSGRYNGIEIQ